MAEIIDRVELSGIVLVRDAILKLHKPYRLESGEPSFSVPDHIKEAMTRALHDDHTHYVASSGILELRKAIVAKCHTVNGIPIETINETIVTNGGMHGLYTIFQAMLEPGDEVLIPDPPGPAYSTSSPSVAAQSSGCLSTNISAGPSTPTSYEPPSTRAPAPS